MRKLMIPIVAGVVIAGGVTVGAQVFAKEDDSAQFKQVHQAESVSADNEGLTLAEASDIALERAGNGVVTEAEKDRDNGRVVYEIEVKNDDDEYDFKIDQQTGEILKEKQEQRKGSKPREGHSSSKGSEAVISMDEAKEIALKEVSGKIDDIELERENGSLVYEVEIESDHYDDDDVTVYVDAMTGNVLYVEWDD
ncbi:PepSY domain-containing protein [Halalkalibacterium halodurans]|uniref:BH0375 protein n=1 Tax=Halalkalibacterium halodurans (strain ATCC BAA-125 / DSM 18197 / FERM 7344 / JCM 9153 / C-125) TaxID=272558 RepID=Q9KFU6_HALH5|nr:PepSY domain-containing protein [Halalkalibacterium halodurans]MDY7220871.1 PepSY domain-containing protein [Halalkalibacterium halodurans]MDY7240110.1 PepSY domain-containing protein [Halalkalibacterium halodurans]MED4082571.1 PepSY domain-containing protein [Halalkalibacterium halodurans]MED4085816.1 PepSY domain-containing protein [Halalkalibacterium halodurans]MED4105682.1 PepSY domain-containing protein [Halalkalibacterium halodurans]